MSAGTIDRPRTGRREAVDPRINARRIEVARAHGRKRLRRLAIVAVLVLLAAGAFALTRSSLLDVDQVAVVGAASSGEDAVLDAAAISPGSPMVSVDPSRVAARVEELPWVADAQVSRSWPGTVQIEVVERVAVAVVGSGPDAALVDHEGRVLGPAGGGSSLPSVGAEPIGEPGTLLSDERRELVKVVSALPESLFDEVASADLVESRPTLFLTDGIEVRLGDVTRLGAKSDAVLALLDQADRATIATIDVSVPSAAALTRQEGEGA